MKLSNKLLQKLNKFVEKRINGRPADFTVPYSGDGIKYLYRWYIIPRNPFFNIYYHVFKVSDDPRYLHDHYYLNCSIILENEYLEHTIDTIYQRTAGDIKVRLPHTLHRIELINNKECRTLFITGPRIREWGFQVGSIVKNIFGFRKKTGWIDHTTYDLVFGFYKPEK